LRVERDVKESSLMRQTMALLTRNSVLKGLSLLALIALCGCEGGDDFGEGVRLASQKHSQLPSTLPVSYPSGDGFNVVDTQRAAKGSALAEASADASGRAMARVDATGGGWGSAEFQIGQVVTHALDAPTAAMVTIQVAYECVTPRQEVGYGETPVALKAYVMDSNRRTLGKILLTQADSGRLPESWRGSQSPSFRVELEPGLAYHMIVAGRVSVGQEHSSEAVDGGVASIEVQSVSVDIEAAGD
jgi:hypothetical protein